MNERPFVRMAFYYVKWYIKISNVNYQTDRYKSDRGGGGINSASIPLNNEEKKCNN